MLDFSCVGGGAIYFLLLCVTSDTNYTNSLYTIQRDMSSANTNIINSTKLFFYREVCFTFI